VGRFLLCSTCFEWEGGEGHTVRKRGRRRRGTLLEKNRIDKEVHTFRKEQKGEGGATVRKGEEGEGGAHC
jgi:hypothetical protein